MYNLPETKLPKTFLITRIIIGQPFFSTNIQLSHSFLVYNMLFQGEYRSPRVYISDFDSRSFTFVKKKRNLTVFCSNKQIYMR